MAGESPDPGRPAAPMVTTPCVPGQVGRSASGSLFVCAQPSRWEPACGAGQVLRTVDESGAAICEDVPYQQRSALDVFVGVLCILAIVWVLYVIGSVIKYFLNESFAQVHDAERCAWPGFCDRDRCSK